MANTTPREGMPDTTDQSPRWEGPVKNRPRGDLPAKDHHSSERDAAGKNLNDPDRCMLGDAGMKEPRQPGELPSYDDPAHSNKPAGSPVQKDAPVSTPPPKDTEYAGHPEFSQDAAANTPPNGIGNSEPADDTDEHTRHSEGVNPKHPSSQQTSGAGPALAKHSKDA